MNFVTLHKYPNGYTLVINSQAAKSDFTSATYEGIITEVNDYLVSTADIYGFTGGVPRLSGLWTDNTDLTISYSTTPTPLNFDGSDNFLISFVNHS